MASISNLDVAIVRHVANAEVTVTYDILWDDFDRATDLDYIETLGLIGDDTGQDGDNSPAGDDPIPNPPGKPLVSIVSANGKSSTSRTLHRTYPFRSLDEDRFGNDSDEIRAVVTLAPQLPVTVSQESSNFEVVTA